MYVVGMFIYIFIIYVFMWLNNVGVCFVFLFNDTWWVCKSWFIVSEHQTTSLCTALLLLFNNDEKESVWSVTTCVCCVRAYGLLCL